MPLKITHRPEQEVPSLTVGFGASEDLHQLRTEMSNIAPGMVLEVDAGDAKTIRGTKNLITRASKQLGRPFVHWHHGTKVYAKPAEGRRRGRPRKVQS